MYMKAFYIMKCDATQNLTVYTYLEKFTYFYHHIKNILNDRYLTIKQMIGLEKSACVITMEITTTNVLSGKETRF